MWPYSNPLSTCNINAVVITCMPTYIHTSPFLIFTGGDPGTRLDLIPSAVNVYMPVATHRNEKINCSYSSLPRSTCLHVCGNEIMCDNTSSVTHFATYHISNSPFHALISEQQVFHSQRKPWLNMHLSPLGVCHIANRAPFLLHMCLDTEHWLLLSHNLISQLHWHCSWRERMYY